MISELIQPILDEISEKTSISDLELFARDLGFYDKVGSWCRCEMSSRGAINLIYRALIERATEISIPESIISPWSKMSVDEIVQRLEEIRLQFNIPRI